MDDSGNSESAIVLCIIYFIIHRIYFIISPMDDSGNSESAIVAGSGKL